MSEKGRIQLNVRILKDTAKQLEEVVEFYQEHTKYGRVYKADVLTDIIEKSHQLMLKKKSINNREY